MYGGRTHHRLASLPDMWNRTITVSSCGKTFSTTGWKVGYCYGAAHLIKPVTAANQWIQYCVSTPTQKAIADMLLQSLKPYEGADSYYAYIRGVYEKKMNALVDSLNAVNLNPIAPEAGFFVMSDTSLHEVPKKYFEQPAPDGSAPTRDWAFAR